MQCWMESRQAVYILYIIGFPFSFIVKSLCTSLRIEKSVPTLKSNKLCFKKAYMYPYQYQFYEGDIF